MNTQKQSKADKIISRITTVIALIVLVVLMVWGGKTLFGYMKYEETNDAQVDEYINPVTARVSGYIKEVKFEENQDVKKGDTLVLIDDDDYTVQQDEASASLLNAKAQVSVQQSNIKTAQSTAMVAEAKIAAAKARLWKQQTEYNRYKKLFDAESATRQQLENIESLLQVAQAEYQAAKEDYMTAISRTNDIKAQRDVLESEIKRRQAVVKRNNLNTSYTVIVAPYDGKMGRRTIQAGQLVQTGQTIAYIVDRSAGKWVVANFKETQIARMYVGEKVNVEVDAFPGQLFIGEIESLSGATGSRFSLLPPDNATGNFVKIAQRIPVRIRLDKKDNATEHLSAGMSASVIVKRDGKND